MNLNQVTIPSRDLKVSVPFYRVLGLRLIVDALPRYARFECPEGEATFSIHHTDRTPIGEGVVVYFECSELDADVARLQAQGIAFDELPADKDWLWREARLRDPDGNTIIFYKAGNNRKNPPWRIN